MSRDVYMEFVDDDRRRKVEFIRRADGGFTFEEWSLIEDDMDEHTSPHWCPVSGGTVPICETFEIALREARGRIPWLGEMLPED